MLKIIAILQEKMEEQKLKNKVNRVKNSIQAARLNAETDLMEVADNRIKAVESLKDKDTETVLAALVDLEERENAIRESLQNLDKVEKYLFEEVMQKK
jgi:Tfp pilus assembly protein FimT